MHDHRSRVTFDITDFEDDRCMIRSDHHRETLTKIPDADGISVRVEDLFTTQAVLEG